MQGIYLSNSARPVTTIIRLRDLEFVIILAVDALAVAHVAGFGQRW
jgi:hypothetical protein